MVYNGQSHENGWFGGTPILGNLHMCSSLMIYFIVDMGASMKLTPKENSSCQLGETADSTSPLRNPTWEGHLNVLPVPPSGFSMFFHHSWFHSCGCEILTWHDWKPTNHGVFPSVVNGWFGFHLPIHSSSVIFCCSASVESWNPHDLPLE